jgi:uncharacterized protein YjiS (DUF1127 family)
VDPQCGLSTWRAAVDVAIEEIFAELLGKAQAGELPVKKADMLRNLRERVEDGKALSEMQEELLRDLAAECGICNL